MNALEANATVTEAIPEGESAERFNPLFDRERIVGQVRAWLERDGVSKARALLCLRPDGFGEIDERFGPLGSDALMRALGEFIASQLGDRAIVDRFGGNLFTVLLEKPTMSDIVSAAEELLNALSETIIETSSLSTSMTASIGILELSELVPDEIRALSRVQAAAREAHRQGGNQLLVDRELDASDEERAEHLRWSRKIRHALENSGFRVVYQPIASLADSADNNFDVLVRMLDEDQQELMPAQFMSTAESDGLMPDIDRWVIKRALQAAAARWSDGKQTRIFFRVSEQSLQDKRFFGWLGLETVKHALDPDGVVVQISEQVAERNLALARQLGQTCRDLHHKMCLANAGTSRNGLKLVKELPIDYLSIDGSFMQNTADSATLMRVRRMISVAKSKGARVIASRVEDARTLSKLVNLGVDYVVGYHVHVPKARMVDEVAAVDAVAQE